MDSFGFGQPHNGVIQMAYIVEDISSAMHSWAEQMNVGPWFLIDHFTGLNAKYRGGPTDADISLAMGYAGHMQIELIQPNDNKPSVYKEVFEARGWGFHHFGIPSFNFDADVAKYEAKGYELAFIAGVPTGGSVAYMDTHGELPGMLELIEVGPTMDEMFTKFYRASIDWDRSNPVRVFG